MGEGHRTFSQGPPPPGQLVWIILASRLGCQTLTAVCVCVCLLFALLGISYRFAKSEFECLGWGKSCSSIFNFAPGPTPPADHRIHTFLLPSPRSCRNLSLWILTQWATGKGDVFRRMQMVFQNYHSHVGLADQIQMPS